MTHRVAAPFGCPSPLARSPFGAFGAGSAASPPHVFGGGGGGTSAAAAASSWAALAQSSAGSPGWAVAAASTGTDDQPPAAKRAKTTAAASTRLRRAGLAATLVDLPDGLIAEDIVTRLPAVVDRASLAISCSGLLVASQQHSGIWWARLDLAPPPGRAYAASTGLSAWLARRRPEVQEICWVHAAAQGPAASTVPPPPLAITLPSPPLPQLCHLELLGLNVDYPQLSAALTHTHLTHLSLKGCKLHCVLPEAVGRLTRLTYLDLTACGLKGALPAGLAHLPVLQELRLGSNWLVKDWSALSRLAALTLLDVSGCNLTTPPLLLGMTALRSLSMGRNAYLFPHIRNNQEPPPGQEPEAWVRALGALGALTHVDLTHTEMGTLPPCVRHWTALRRLVLDGNVLERPQPTYRPVGWEQLEALTALTHVSLNHCHLWDLPPQLNALPQLQELHLAHNKRLAESLDTWQHLPGLAALTSLDLSACDLRQLPSGLARLKGLRRLALARNYVEGGWKSLLSLRALRGLDLRSNSLKTLPIYLYFLHSLADLHVGDNPDLPQGEAALVTAALGLGLHVESDADKPLIHIMEPQVVQQG